VPIYFKAVAEVPAGEIIAHRVYWSLLLVGAVVGLRHATGALALLRGSPPRLLAMLLATTLLLAANWLVFVWAGCLLYTADALRARQPAAASV
jgi:chloramphenicol-sensitive protein RarD